MAEENNNKFFKINKQTISCKIACFLTSAYMGSFIPFLNVFFVSVGLSEFQAGILTALVYTPCIITGPMFGYLADYTKRRRLIFIGISVAAAATVFSFPWLADVLQPSPYLPPCNVTEIAVRHNSNTSVNTTMTTCGGSTATSNDKLFSALFAIVFLAAIFIFPLLSFLEATVANVSAMLGSSFGAQRIFGEIGISVSTYGTGAACDHFDVKKLSEYSPAFFIFPIICLVTIPVGCYIIGHADSESVVNTENNKETSSHREEGSILKKMIKLCFRSDVLMFLMTVFIGGIANALYLNFTLKYVVDKMHRTKAESSYVFICTAVVSSITFPIASRLIYLLRGTIPALLVALLTTTVRLFIVSYDIPFVVFVGVHLLNGFAFALFYSSLVEHVRRISPPDINMTMNNITLALFFYVGALVGNIGGSKVYKMLGGAMLFRVQSFVCAVWTIITFVFYKYTNRDGNRHSIRSSKVDNAADTVI